jgi:hypothetical protein
VDVDEIPGDGSTRAFRIRFRSVGSRAAITGAITGDLPPVSVALTVLEEGGASAAETVLLVLSPRLVASLTTSGWSALSAPTIAISTLATGSASVSSSFRIAVGTSTSAIPKSYHFRIVVGGFTTARISTEAGAADVEDAISDALGTVGTWKVRKPSANTWEITKAAVGVATMTLTDSLVDYWPGLSGTLNLDTAGCISLISGSAEVMARATIETGTGEMLYRETLPLRAAVEGLGSTSPIVLARTVTSASAPTTGDDSADGYGLFSLWINTSTDLAYILTDNTEGAAVWTQVGGGSAGTLVSVPASEDDSGSDGDYSFDSTHFYKYYPAPVAKWRRTPHDAF